MRDIIGIRKGIQAICFLVRPIDPITIMLRRRGLSTLTLK